MTSASSFVLCPPRASLDALRGQPVRARVAPRVMALLDGSHEWTASKQQLTAQRVHEMRDLDDATHAWLELHP